MGAMFSPPSMPSPPPPPPVPPAAIPPTMASDAVQGAKASQMARAAAGLSGGTRKTGAGGDLSAPPTAKAALLGQT